MSEPEAGPADLFRQLVSVFAEQLARFRKEDPVGNEETRAKALAVLAKTLESITAVGIKLNAVGAAQIDPQHQGAGIVGSGSKANDTAELDRHLTQLVGNLVQAGKAE